MMYLVSLGLLAAGTTVVPPLASHDPIYSGAK